MASAIVASNSLVDVSDQRTAADERHAKSHAFFFREADHFNRKRQPAASETLDQSDAEHDAQDSVERSRVRNRVEMRADEQARRIRAS